MRSGLVVTGLLLLVFGLLLAGGPAQIFGTTTTTENGSTDTNSVNAYVGTSPEWGTALALVGALLFLIGLVAPSKEQTTVIRDRDDDYYETEEKTDRDTDYGNRRVVRTQRIRR